MGTHKTFLCFTCVLVVAVSAIGCGGDDEAVTPAPDKVTPQAAQPASPRTDAPAPPKSSAGQVGSGTLVEEQLNEAIEIPSFYPDDGPLYPGVKPSKAQQLESGKVNLMFGTDAMPSDAANVMAEAAEANGWKIVSVSEIDRGVVTRGEKNGRMLLIVTNRVDDGSGDVLTLVAVNVEP